MNAIIEFMDDLFPIVIAVIVVVLFLSLMMILANLKGKGKKKDKQKLRQNVIRDSMKKLSQDPHNVRALRALADIYYQEYNWEKAYPLLETLMNLSMAHSEKDSAETGIRFGICALKLNKVQESFRGLLAAKQQWPENFEVNYYLGQAFLQNKEYEKAIPYLRKALVLNQEVAETYKFLGTALYFNKNFKESLGYFKRSLDANPENKEILFYLADALNETGSVDRALKIFMHLRPDPEYGARSSLSAGSIHFNENQLEKALQDFEIGLRHTSAPLEFQLDLRYRMAQTCLKINDISRGLTLLKEIQAMTANYKDVQALINRYQELNQNKNLQTYLMAGNSDFVALCRKIVMNFFRKSHVKITDIAVQSEYTDVLTEIETDKWEDIVVFRFYRTTGSTGELYVRDFHGKLRDAKAGKGICFTAGTYTDEARKYTEGRPLDLIDKQDLIKILSKVDSALIPMI